MSFTVALLCPHDDSGQCTCKTLSHGRLSIWTAAEYGLTEVVRTSVEADYSRANAHDAYGYTPLHYAAQHGKVEVLQLLLKRGALVDSAACGATALHRAAASNAVQSCELLIQAGADVNLADNSFGDRRTPLMKAASLGHVDVVRLLLSTGKDDQSAKDSAGLSAWDLAYDHPPVRALLKPPATASSLTRVSSSCGVTKATACITNHPTVVEDSKSSVSLMCCSHCGAPSLFMQRFNDSLVCRACRLLIVSS